MIRARPALSTRIFGWKHVSSERGLGTTTYSFEIAMNYVTGVEVMKALSDAR